MGISDYHAETIADEGETPVSIAVDVSALDEAYIEPDVPSIKEPIMTVLREMHDWGRYTGEDAV